MATNDDKRVIQVAALDIQKINEAFRQLCNWVGTLEGRNGPINLRSRVSIDVTDDTLIDFPYASIVNVGTESSSIAFAKGSRKPAGGDWIALDTVSVIWSLDRTGNGTLYVNTGLTIGQAFTPTSAFVVGVGGDVSTHALISNIHTASGLTTGHVLQATAATTFDFAALVPSAARFNYTGVLSGTSLVWDTETWNSSSGNITRQSSNTQVKTVVAGYYRVSVQAYAEITTGGQADLILTRYNSGAASQEVFKTRADNTGAGSINMPLSLTRTFSCSANDYFVATLIQNAGTVTLYIADALWGDFSIERLN